MELRTLNEGKFYDKKNQSHVRNNGEEDHTPDRRGINWDKQNCKEKLKYPEKSALGIQTT